MSLQPSLLASSCAPRPPQLHPLSLPPSCGQPSCVTLLLFENPKPSESLTRLSCPLLSCVRRGASTAAYQIEGSYNVSKQPSIWDVLTNTCHGCVANNDTGNVADDSYVRYREDTALLANLSLNAYRFSISWPRIITLQGTVNPTAIAHYSDLIDGLLAKGITPLVSLYHGDLPYAYDTQPNSTTQQGWHNATYLIPRFLLYATTCFEAFGDRVKHWVTLNEPRYFCELYGCGHTAILVHAHTVAAYRAMKQGGVIGMVIDGQFSIPLTRSQADVDAAERALVFDIGWLADPIFFGQSTQEYARVQTAGEERLFTSRVHCCSPDRRLPTGQCAAQQSAASYVCVARLTVPETCCDGMCR